MSWMLPVGFLLTCAAVVALLVERRQRARRWQQERRGLEELAETLATQLGDARRRADGQAQRRRAAERVLSRLARRLEVKPLDDDDRQLLADLYHEYGTETHDYYFPASTGDGGAQEER